MEKTINLTDPIRVTFYGTAETVGYTKLVLTQYNQPRNQGMLLISASGNDSETLVVTINLSYPMEPDVVIINVNDSIVEKQVLPALIKRGLIEPEPCRAIKSGFVTYPAYELSVTAQ